MVSQGNNIIMIRAWQSVIISPRSVPTWQPPRLSNPCVASSETPTNQPLASLMDQDSFPTASLAVHASFTFLRQCGEQGRFRRLRRCRRVRVSFIRSPSSNLASHSQLHRIVLRVPISKPLPSHWAAKVVYNRSSHNPHLRLQIG